MHVYIHRESSYLQQNIDRFIKHYLAVTLSKKFAIKDHYSSTTSKRCRYTTLRHISFQKMHRPKAQQRQIRRAHTEENVTAIGELILSQ